MAGQDAIKGAGVTFKGTTTLSSGAAMVENVSYSGPTVDDIDLTSPDSDNNYKAFCAGMIDPGEITVDVCFDGTSGGTADEVYGAVGSAVEAWTITFSDTTTLVVSGYIKSVTAASPHEDKVTMSITIKCTGEPTYTDLA